MQMLIRLHDPADMDLIYLKLRYRKRFPGMVRKCLRSHIEGRDSVASGGYFIEFGDRRIGSFAKHPSEPLLVNLNLRKNEDADIIGFLSEIRDFAKSDVVKNIVRAHYTRFPAELFRGAYVSGRKPEPGVDPDRFGTEPALDSSAAACAVSPAPIRDSVPESAEKSSEEIEKTVSDSPSKPERPEKRSFSLRKKPEAEEKPSETKPKASTPADSEADADSAASAPKVSEKPRKPAPVPPAASEEDDDPFSMLENMMNH